MLDRLAELGNPFDDEDRNWRPHHRQTKFANKGSLTDEQIIPLRELGLSALVIAGKLGVTKSAIQKRLQILGMGGALVRPGRPKKR